MQEQSLFIEALEKEDPTQRAAFLDQACAGDAALRQRLDRLLARHEQSGDFLEPATPKPLATIDDPVKERPGTVIGQYKLMEQIGEGGMGLVFVAEQTQPVRRKVALKVIKPGMDTRHVIARFEAERQALALMDHPHIAKVFDGGTTPTGRPYFVMELVKGVPITEFCDDNHLSVRERLQLFSDVCSAVQHAHHKGIIHRDLKPSNVMVTSHDGTPVVKIIDFGIAKAIGQQLTEKTLYTQLTQMVGTPMYMSPEQAGQSGLDVDTRTDIYALGVLLYQLLTGTTPFDGERLQSVGYDEMRRIIREEEPLRPSTRISTLGLEANTMSANRKCEPNKLRQLMRGEVDWIVMKALEKDRNRRYETASAFAADVGRYLNDEPVLACPPSQWYQLRKFTRRYRAALATATVVSLVVSVAAAVSTALIWRANRDLQHIVERERREAYFHRISLAHRDLSTDNLARASRLLRECPVDLRGWEWDYLMRLCKVEPVVLRDTTEVHGVAFSPGGEWLASAGGDGAIKIRNSRTGKVIQTLANAHTRAVVSVAFHPDGQHLASVGMDRRVKVWELATEKERFNESCDAIRKFGTAYTVAFSADGKRLATASEGAVRHGSKAGNREKGS